MPSGAWAGPFDVETSLNPHQQILARVMAEPSEAWCADKCYNASVSALFERAAFLYRRGDFATAYNLLFAVVGADSITLLGRFVAIEYLATIECACKFFYRADISTAQPTSPQMTAMPQPLS